MGTNYYIHNEICKCCYHPKHEWHIGKSGRTLRYYDAWDGPYGEPATSMDQWEALIRDERSTVVDEYGATVDKEWIIGHFRENATRELLPIERQYGGYVVDARGHVLLKGYFS